MPDPMPLGPLMLDIDGLQLTEADRQLLQQPAVGGLILFARNFASRPQLLDLVAQIRAARPGILIAVDQEGGRVQRFKADGFTRLPPMQRLRDSYRADSAQGRAQAQDLGFLMASEILACGIDISFAPVLDVDEDFSSIIGDRAFSDDSAEVIELAGAFMAGMHSAGMATTGKHFPGHGGVREDSHLTLPVDSRSWAEIEARDMATFKALLPQLDALMPAHIIFPAVDSEPVGFSSHWLQQRLRQQLNYDGVLFSDDLSMEGAVQAGSYPQRAVAALSAGCDMVLVCNNREGAEQVCAALADWNFSEHSRRRLQTMLARRQAAWQSLATEPRWQRAQSLAAELC
ncbi:MAG: beta-N-acetylhexosaminidase [Cellvibrionaceae bacterium]|nr:beta-N-acetylhexosaminidase [Cellvibrionaceae bacterium]